MNGVDHDRQADIEYLDVDGDVVVGQLDTDRSSTWVRSGHLDPGAGTAPHPVDAVNGLRHRRCHAATPPGIRGRWRGCRCRGRRGAGHSTREPCSSAPSDSMYRSSTPTFTSTTSR